MYVIQCISWALCATFCCLAYDVTTAFCGTPLASMFGILFFNHFKELIMKKRQILKEIYINRVICLTVVKVTKKMTQIGCRQSKILGRLVFILRNVFLPSLLIVTRCG